MAYTGTNKTIKNLYSLQIAGIPGKYYYPTLPSWAGPEDNTGLYGVPSGFSSNWRVLDAVASQGTWSFQLRHGVGLNLLNISPAAITELTGALATDQVVFGHIRTNSEAGIVSGSLLFLNTETIEITFADPSQYNFIAKRGYAGTDPVSGTAGQDIFFVPPALSGRGVTFSEVASGSATDTSTVMLRGFLSSEPARKMNGPVTLSVKERFDNAKLGDTLDLIPVGIEEDRVRVLTNPAGSDKGRMTPPRFHDDGGYIYISSLGAVFKGAWDGDAQHWIMNSVPILPNKSFASLDAPSDTEEFGHQVAIANPDLDYSTFGYTDKDTSSFVYSDHPIDIILNILVSKDGTNTSAGQHDYDLGETLYPVYARGIDADLIDWEAFNRVRNCILIDTHAPWFVLGDRALSYQDAWQQLLGPLFMTISTTRTGLYTVRHLTDVYPGEDPYTTVDDSRILEPERISEQVAARSINKVTLHTNWQGSRDNYGNVISITAPDERHFYPSIVGGSPEFKTPYDIVDLQLDDGSLHRLGLIVGSTLGLFAGRVYFVKHIKLMPEIFPDLDVGDTITLHLTGVNDGQGTLMTANSAGVGAVITNISNLDWNRRTATIEVVITDEGKNLGVIGPALILDSEEAPGATSFDTVDASEDDYSYFSVGSQVILLNPDGSLKSDAGRVQESVVVVADGAVLEIDTPFESAGGSNIDPALGDIVVLANWDGDAHLDADKALFVWVADGPVNRRATLGSGQDDPFVYGT